MLQHPLPALIAHGVSTALSNDDPAIEGQNDAGLSYDFYEAIQGFQNIGLAGLVSQHFRFLRKMLTFARVIWHRIPSGTRILKIRTMPLGSLILRLASMGMVSKLNICKNGRKIGRTFVSGL